MFVSTRTVLSLALGWVVSASVQAAPVTYTFKSLVSPESALVSSPGEASLIALLGEGQAVTGSFTYDSAAAKLGDSGALGLFPDGHTYYGGNTLATAAYAQLTVSVGGHVFTDAVGVASVVDGSVWGHGGADIVALDADPHPAPGQTLSDLIAAPSLGAFSVGGYELVNISLSWNQLFFPDVFTPATIQSDADGDAMLPSLLPLQHGFLTFTFRDPTAPEEPLFVRYADIELTAAGVQPPVIPGVPEPGSMGMLLSGLAVMAASVRRVRA
jgi:hypothetical protein